MYKVGIAGHKPEFIPNPDAVKNKMNLVMDTIGYQYGQELVFNVAGDTGVGLWAAEICTKSGYKYHLYLPYPIEDMENLWLKEQFEELKSYFSMSWAVGVAYPHYAHGALEQENYRHLIDSSEFIVCFWNGRKAGIIADTIRYALSKNKLILNGLDDLKLITAKEVENI